MNRRDFLAGLGAGAAVAAVPRAARAALFQPTRFSVQVHGAGPDVILIPGLTASREVWRTTIAALPGYRYHLLQIGGFAGEPVRGNRSGPLLVPIAEELSRYIASRGLRRPAIVGHSMGGTIGMLLAARHPGQVGRLMVVDMLPQAAGMFGTTADGMRGLADSLHEVTATSGGRELFASLLGMFGGNGGRNASNDPDVVAKAMHELATLDLKPQLPRIAVPMTVLYACFDAQRRAQLDQIYGRAYRARPGTRLVRIDGAGHMIMYDRPTRFREELRGFLRG